MESKKKIKTVLKDLGGKKLNLPIDGEVTISEDGTVEVSELCCELLVVKGSGWIEVKDTDTDGDSDIVNDADSIDLSKEKVLDNKIADDSNKVDLRAKFKPILKEMKFTDLKNLALSLELHKKNMDKYRKAKSQVKMYAYVFKHITEEQLKELDKQSE